MTTMISGSQVRALLLGTKVSKAVANTIGTKSLFTVTGGKVVITSLVGEVTTALTVAGTTKIQSNPTVGATGDLVAATDLGTTDTPVGDLLSLSGIPGDSVLIGIGAGRVGWPIIVTAGVIEQVTATGGDGNITWTCTWVPLDDGASLVAA